MRYDEEEVLLYAMALAEVFSFDEILADNMTMLGGKPQADTDKESINAQSSDGNTSENDSTDDLPF